MRPLLPALLGAVLLAGCRPAPAGPTAGAAPLAVHTEPARTETLPALLELPATVRPAERAVISARVSGTIATLPWGLGQEVRAGEVLVTLSVPEAAARVRQAQAQLAEAERATDRQRTLVEKGVNPADSLRDAEDRLHFAQAQLAEAEAVLSHGRITAPFTGIVTEKQVLPGDLATPGLPLLTLESATRLRAEGTIPENSAATLKLGQPLAVAMEGADHVVAGPIEELSSAADAVSRSVLAKVALPAGSARSGQFARLLVPAGQSTVLVVPSAAVSRFGQMERVFVADNGRAVLRLVKTGRATAGATVILSGLDAGERVIVHPPAALREGDRVTEGP